MSCVWVWLLDEVWCDDERRGLTLNGKIRDVMYLLNPKVSSGST